MVHLSSMAKRSAALKPVAQKVLGLQILGRWEKTDWEMIGTSAMDCCQRTEGGLAELLFRFIVVADAALSAHVL